MSVEFGEWVPLSRDALERFPSEPGAFQVRRAEGLVAYPDGKSAMVFYAFAQTNIQKSLLDLFADEVDNPGARGHGTLWVRWNCSENALAALSDLYSRFENRFGSAPIFHAK